MLLRCNIRSLKSLFERTHPRWRIDIVALGFLLLRVDPGPTVQGPQAWLFVGLCIGLRIGRQLEAARRRSLQLEGESRKPRRVALALGVGADKSTQPYSPAQCS